MDIVLLSFHQTHCFRFCEYFKLRDAFDIFPKGLAEEVRCLGAAPCQTAAGSADRSL
jgi:hypothetical protein